MPSEISILRKFLSMDLNLGTVSIDNGSEFHIRYISLDKSKSLYFGNNRINFHILYIHNGNDMYIVDGRMAISNEQEFLETDDISLVLRYGRDILDENIIKKYNKKHNNIGDYSKHAITLSDFDAFLNSGE